MINELRVLISR